MDFDQKFASYRITAEMALQKWTHPGTTRPGKLHQAIAHSLTAGGKRIRPILVLACADLFPSDIDASPAAAAVEMLHTYTLVHDDLPAMDNSPLRRGRPSTHVAYDEATAILAGDALLTEAFAILAQAYAPTPEVGLKLVAELASASGSQRLIGGQAEDTDAEGKQLSANDLDYIHLNKTAALLEACCRMGIHCSQTSDPSVLDKITTAARNMGLAFQILDDILDATATAEEMGKSVRADAANQKNTYVALHGLDASRKHATQKTKQALDALLRIDADTSFLEALFSHLLSRKN